MSSDARALFYAAAAPTRWFRVLRGPGAHVELDFLADGIVAQTLARGMNLQHAAFTSSEAGRAPWPWGPAPPKINGQAVRR